MRQSGFLQRQAEKQEDISQKLQLTWKQFMIDTLLITLHQEFGWGETRLRRLNEAWEANRKEYFPAIDPRMALCDVKQEHMQRVFREICGAGKDVPFAERYPYLKEVRYDKKGKKHG